MYLKKSKHQIQIPVNTLQEFLSKIKSAKIETSEKNTFYINTQDHIKYVLNIHESVL